MKAVFSFWNTSDDALKRATNWANPKFHLYSWVLAVNKASKYFDEVELVTDSTSLSIFQKLNLPFTNIRTDLDELKSYPKSLWALGKIKAYQIQDKPFIHIDNDFILFNPLPDWFLKSPISFQNVEDGNWFEDSYRGQFENIRKNGRLPYGWGACEKAYNFGIYVCNDMNYNRRYTDAAFELVDKNIALIEQSGVAGLYCVLFEQYMGATVAETMDIKASFLTDPFNKKEQGDNGWVHIWGGKKNDQWFENIEKIVKNNYPEQFRIVNDLVK